MNTAFKPIKTLLIISIALHIVSLCAVALIYILQMPIRAILHGHSAGDIFHRPTLLTLIPIAVFFILHYALTLGFWKNIHHEDAPASSLRTLSVLSLVFTIFVIPVAGWFIAAVENLVISRMGDVSFVAFIHVRMFVLYALNLRSLAFTLLIMAAAMAFYHTYLKRNDTPLTTMSKRLPSAHIHTFQTHLPAFSFLGIQSPLTPTDSFDDLQASFFELGGYNKILPYATDPTPTNIRYTNHIGQQHYFQGLVAENVSHIPPDYTLSRFQGGDFLVVTHPWVPAGTYQAADSRNRLLPHLKTLQIPEGYVKNDAPEAPFIERENTDPAQGSRYEFWIPIKKST